MTPLRIALLFVAVVAGDYAALMLIDCQLVHFGVAAAVCGGSSVAAGLIAYGDDEHARRQHALSRRRRMAVAPRPLCGGCQTRSDSPRFADRQVSRGCEECAPAPSQGRPDELATGRGAPWNR